MTTYRVILVESEEGFAVSCPALKGCHSQGATREEALDNIKIAIREWLEAEGVEKSLFNITEEEVAV
jgi:predicted RNase H-like HicB family nuclease